MAKKSTETGPSITYHTYSGIPIDESCTDRSVIEAVDGGDITYTFQDDTTVTVTVLAGARYVLSSDVKTVTATGEINMF